MSELKKCPFCGGKAVTSTFFDWEDLEYMAIEVNDSESIDAEVTCENERCINGWWLSPKDWNTRPIEDALNARIAELEKNLSNKEIEYTDLWDDALALQARIAELEAFINQLIEVSEKMFTAVIAAADPYDEGMRVWDKLVRDWKEV